MLYRHQNYENSRKNEYSLLLIKRCTYLFMLLCPFVFTGQLASRQLESPHSIRQAFEEKVISVDEAVMAHFRIYEEDGPHKCATPAHMFFHRHRSELAPATLDAVNTRYAPARRSRSLPAFISPSGKFEINYETSGPDAVPSGDTNTNGVPDYVEWVAEAMDSSYRHEVLTLGYTDPIPAGEQYVVTLQDIGGAYGYATINSGSPGGTEIFIENDFAGFPSNDDPQGDQRGAIKVTAAHELKHAIQFVQNNWNGDTDRWAEMDATLMEEVVYDNVNDYYNYISGFGSNIFEAPYNTIIPGSYEDVTFALFFHEKYGADFWVNVWDEIESGPSSLELLTLVQQEVEARGDNYPEVLAENYMWHYATGISNSPTNFGFEERLDYPVDGAFVERSYTDVPDTLSSEFSLVRYSADFMEVDLDESRSGYVDIRLLYDEPFVQLGLLAYFPDGSVESRFLAAQSSGQSQILTNWEWNEITRLALVAVNSDPVEVQRYRIQIRSDLPAEIQLSQNYPNPFNPSTQIPVSIPTQQNVTLEVYDITGRKIRTLHSGTLAPGFYQFPFESYDLSSGTYLYKLTTGEGTFFKTMTLIK